MKSLTLTASTFAMIGMTIALSPSVQAAVALPEPGACTPFPACTGTGTGLDPFVVSFNENGKAAISVNGGPVTTLTGKLMADPSGGPGGAPVLTYFLPEPVITGDAEFTEPGAGGALSDVLRFTDAAGRIGGGVSGAGVRMIFYSEFETGELKPDMADTGFPANLGTGNKLITAELGTERSNGWAYTPGGNVYNGISDVIPEPVTWVMMLMGFAGLGFAGYRKARCRTAFFDA
jgi:PEP-CTERM motif-containing protein